MPICIYCRCYGEKLSDEHVMPEMFGTFEDNFVLHSVCEPCNNSFSGRELSFGRDSSEGLLRLRHGLKPADEAHEVARARAASRILQQGMWRGAKMLMRGGENGFEAYPPPQVGFISHDQFVWFDEEDVTAAAVEPYREGFRVAVLADTTEGVERLTATLARLGIELKDAQPLSEPGEKIDDENFRVDVESGYIITSDIQRTIAKIAFNYLAYIAGAPFVLQRDFDAMRNFIRYGTELQWRPAIATRERILFGDRRDMPITSAHLLSVEWQQRKRDGLSMIAQVSFFNTITYRLMLCRMFAGIFLPVISAHAFDFRSRRIVAISAISRRLLL